MKSNLLFFSPILLLLNLGICFAQSPLTVEKVMQDPKLSVGALPSNVFWAENSQQIYFNWQTGIDTDNQLYSVDFQGNNLKKVDDKEKRTVEALRNGNYNATFTKKLFTQSGDIFLYDIAKGQTQCLTFTVENENNPRFLQDESQIVYEKSGNLFLLSLQNGSTTQLTNFKKGDEPNAPKGIEGEKWLNNQQTTLFEYIRKQQEEKEKRQERQKKNQAKHPKAIYTQDYNVEGLTVSPDARFVTFRLSKRRLNKETIVQNYVTASGAAEDLTTRAKVGQEETVYQLGLYDIFKDTTYYADFRTLEGYYDLPEFYKEYPNYDKKLAAKDKKTAFRSVMPHGAYWSPDGKMAVVVLRAADNKDRWIAQLNLQDASFTLLDRQHDEAWIGGPNIEGWVSFGGQVGWLPNGKDFYYFSEVSGYSHLYKIDVTTKEKKALTQGNYEVRFAQLSRDKKSWYLITSEVHAGEDQLYRMPLDGGKTTRLTTMTGGHEAFIAPNEKQIALLYSYSNKPWELFVMENKEGSKAKQVTNSTSEFFRSYAWREPQIVTFKARDGVTVHARLYRPKDTLQASPAVIFVHGAGYLQNAHKHWSTYFREYMFHNFLADNGYTVLDIDYRGSAGYGRDFRTGIYRHMGGKDLTDHADGAKLLVEKYNVNPEKIGIYGGSYGGFITLMALFKEGNTFKAGAALRSVTDWAHYNHPYTANILNLPTTDSLAYTRSSPIYFAEGLKGHLLICHGMIDTNVHFQDVVRLSQRLIELGKDNWEMAVYPIEDHGFVQPSSWTDEYKRIFKLFERTLKGK